MAATGGTFLSAASILGPSIASAAVDALGLPVYATAWALVALAIQLLASASLLRYSTLEPTDPQ